MYEAVYLALELHICVFVSLNRLEAPWRQEKCFLSFFDKDFVNSGAVD